MPKILSLGDAHVLDGAMGTELMAAGLPLGTPAERWVLERPEAIRTVHRAYLAAGAEIVTTATFGATRPNLARHGLAEHGAEINRRAVELAREAAAAAASVAGTLGPLVRIAGAPEPDGVRALDAFREQGEVLRAAGVDLFLVETMTDVDQAVAAVMAVVDGGVPVIASITVRAEPDGAVRLLGGAELGEAVTRLEAAGADAIGLNCMLTAREMLPAVRMLATLTTRPIVAQPNAGAPHPRAGGGFAYGETPEDFAHGIEALRAAGATWTGGCCGTTPAHIEAIRFPSRTGPC